MPRLKFAVGLCLVLAAPAVAGPREAANAVFDDPLEREAFFAMMAADPALTAAVAEAESSGDVKASPLAAGWRTKVVDSLKKSRAALAAGLKLNPPQSDYPDAPLIAPLVKSLHKQNPADLFVSLNVPKYDGPAAPAPAAKTAKVCAPGTAANGALAQAKAASTGDAAAFTGEDCRPAGTEPPKKPAPPPEAPTPPASELVKTPPASSPALTDQRTTTGAPPAPGEDKESSSKESSIKWGHIGMGVGLGATVGLILGFGTPIGAVAGAVIGGLIGAVVGSGLLAGLFS